MKKKEKINQEELFRILNGRVSTVINRYLLTQFRMQQLGITVEQWTVLTTLWKKDKVTQQTLSDLTMRDKPSMTRLITNLEKRGLVTRVQDETDRRANLIHLTQKGMEMEKKASAIVNNVVEKTLAQIFNEEILACRNVLKKIFENLE